MNSSMTYTSSTGPHRLATMLQVLLFDQCGMERSAKPPEPYTMLDFAIDAAAIMGQAQWARAHVVGCSFGGMVAPEPAIGWPDRARLTQA